MSAHHHPRTEGGSKRFGCSPMKVVRGAGFRTSCLDSSVPYLQLLENNKNFALKYERIRSECVKWCNGCFILKQCHGSYTQKF